MKSQLFSKKMAYYFGFAFIANLVLVSCGTYQSVYNNDGIYDDDPVIEKVVVVKNTKRYTKTEESYFKDEIEAFDDKTDREVFDDVDDDSYDDVNNNFSNDNPVVININVRDRFRNYWDFYDFSPRSYATA